MGFTNGQHHFAGWFEMWLSVAAGDEFPKMRRYVLAFLAASLVPALIGVALTPQPGKALFFFAFYCFSLLATVLFGAPTFLLLLYLRLVRWWTGILAGLSIGIIVGAVIRLPSPPETNDILIMAISGSIAGLVFWVVWALGGVDPR